jgi:hypothetical protein
MPKAVSGRVDCSANGVTRSQVVRPVRGLHAPSSWCDCSTGFLVSFSEGQLFEVVIVQVHANVVDGRKGKWMYSCMPAPILAKVVKHRVCNVSTVLWHCPT